ncbi:ectoine/hydroxyectoine ABC transporter substrate-binding protein EhuB [Megalodesulfovibrio paquesii]
MRRLLVFGVCILLCAAVAAGSVWLLSARPWDRSLARLVDSGVIRIGYAIEPPYAFLRPDGDVSGQAPELAKRIVQRLGIEQIEWRVSEFGSLLFELEDGHIDVIAAGMFITQARARRVRFSNPSFRVRQALLVTKGNPHGLHSYEEVVQRPEIMLAALTGSVEAALLSRLGVQESQLVLVPDAATGLAALDAGLVDGLALSSPAIDWMIRHDQTGRLDRAQPFVQPLPAEFRLLGYGGFAFRTNDRALVDAWNTEQKHLLDSRDFWVLMQEFGFTSEEHPGDLQFEDIVAP